MRLPDFIVIGAMKSATSTLHDQLVAQAGLFLSTPKEPCFFSDDDVYARGIDWYAGLFAVARPSDLCGESSTHYTKLPTFPDTVERMRRHLPRVKLVYVMRHPVDRLVSHYVHEWSEGRARGPLDEALARHPELVDYGRYAMQLRPYLETWGRESVLPVFFERLVRAPQAELERVARFVGHRGPVRWSGDAGRRNVSEERIRRNWAWSALQRWPRLRALNRAVVPERIRHGLKRRLQMRERPVLSPEARSRVEARLDADLGELGEWLGVQLDCRRFAGIVAEAPLGWKGRTP
jgi:Sulfotransferase domain